MLCFLSVPYGISESSFLPQLTFLLIILMDLILFILPLLEMFPCDHKHFHLLFSVSFPLSLIVSLS